MARTIAQIQQSIVDAKNADLTLSGLTSTSNVAMWLLWTWVVATAQWLLESLFDAHKAEVQEIIATQKPHTLQWYATMARLFQYGVTLPADTDTYPDPAPPGSLIVAYAAAVETPTGAKLKVAKDTGGGVLGPLAGGELGSFGTYMGRIKDAGVRLICQSSTPDNLQLAVTVYYDPLILDATGARLDGAAPTPVRDEVEAFLTQLPFNGLLVANKLLEAVESNVEGVRILKIRTIQANYGATGYVAVDPDYTPDAGYIVLDAGYFNANVTYVAHGPIS